jgi:hypothetical protein
LVFRIPPVIVSTHGTILARNVLRWKTMGRFSTSS